MTGQSRLTKGLRSVKRLHPLCPPLCGGLYYSDCIHFCGHVRRRQLDLHPGHFGTLPPAEHYHFRYFQYPKQRYGTYSVGQALISSVFWTFFPSIPGVINTFVAGDIAKNLFAAGDPAHQWRWGFGEPRRPGPAYIRNVLYPYTRPGAPDHSHLVALQPPRPSRPCRSPRGKSSSTINPIQSPAAGWYQVCLLATRLYRTLSLHYWFRFVLRHDHTSKLPYRKMVRRAFDRADGSRRSAHRRLRALGETLRSPPVAPLCSVAS